MDSHKRASEFPTNIVMSHDSTMQFNCYIYMNNRFYLLHCLYLTGSIDLGKFSRCSILLKDGMLLNDGSSYLINPTPEIDWIFELFALMRGVKRFKIFPHSDLIADTASKRDDASDVSKIIFLYSDGRKLEILNSTVPVRRVCVSQIGDSDLFTNGLITGDLLTVLRNSFNTGAYYRVSVYAA